MLYIVATPIGNLEDVSPRTASTLAGADGIACEDTRRTRRLLSHLEIPAPEFFISYREGNEMRAGERILNALKEGLSIALCSDSGYPGISDPGYRLISLAVEHDQPIEVIPGPSAVPLALLLSGLPTSSYTFKGYPPRKKGQRIRFFSDEKDLPHTLICFESPFRVGATLEAAREALGDRKAAVCIELTKKFERVSRGFLSDLVVEYSDRKVKGEVSIAIAGNHPKFLRA